MLRAFLGLKIDGKHATVAFTLLAATDDRGGNEFR
jgi:hypothetical protein